MCIENTPSFLVDIIYYVRDESLALGKQIPGLDHVYVIVIITQLVSYSKITCDGITVTFVRIMRCIQYKQKYA